MHTFYLKMITQEKTTRQAFSERDYDENAAIIGNIGNYFLAKEGKELVIDKYNKKVFKFLMLYFNGKQEALEVFPDKNYSLKKNILLTGKPGTGKTLTMQIFSEYLKKTLNPLRFYNIGATELINFQKMHGHINPFTYNIERGGAFDGNPINLCLNDIGFSAQEQKSFGTDLKAIFDEFIYSRYEIWINSGKRFHITTNLDGNDFKKMFDSRIIDRMKIFNVIAMEGDSRR